MTTLFTKIIQGDLPSYKVYEDERHFAFLTIEPLTDGHTLLVPRKESVMWTDMTTDEVKEIFSVALTLSQKLKDVFEVPRVALIIAGFEVAHTHLHLIPCHSEEELDFSNARKAELMKLERIHKRIIL
jgi:histidine triad (HIT) family protein